MTQKFIPLLLILVLAGACKKDKNTNNSTNEPPPLSVREQYIADLEGIWDLSEVRYSFTLPSLAPGVPPVPLSGAGEDVSGIFNFTTEPQEVNYNFSFSVGLPNPLTGDTISLPISMGNKGSYTVNEQATRITVTDDDGEQQQFEILLDRPAQQNLRTVTTMEIPTVGSIDVTAEISITR